MKAQLYRSILVAAAVAGGVRAENDHDYACREGHCVSHTARGEKYTMTVWGPPESLGDITDDADWVVLDCKKGARNQHIRLVCKSDDSAKCMHLEKGGALHKIVKLPKHCGVEPFARLSKFGISHNQDIPAHAIPKLARRQTEPQVLHATIDHELHERDDGKPPVFFTVSSMNVPHVDDSPAQRRRGLLRRAGDAVLDFQTLIATKLMFQKFTPEQKKTIKELVNEKYAALGDAAQKAKETLEKGEFSSNASFYDKDFVVKDKTVTLFEPKIGCGNHLEASFKATSTGNTDLKAILGAVVIGRIRPKVELDYLGTYSDLHGDFDGKISLSGSIVGTLDTGDTLIQEFGPAALMLPSFLAISVGPRFQIQARLMGTVDISGSMDIGLKYMMDQVKLYYPQTDEFKNSGKLVRQDPTLLAEVEHTLASKVELTGHLMPRFAFGVTLPGKKNADVFAEFDASFTTGLVIEKPLVKAPIKAKNGTVSDDDDDEKTKKSKKTGKDENPTDKKSGDNETSDDDDDDKKTENSKTGKDAAKPTDKKSGEPDTSSDNDDEKTKTSKTGKEEEKPTNKKSGDASDDDENETTPKHRSKKQSGNHRHPSAKHRSKSGSRRGSRRKTGRPTHFRRGVRFADVSGSGSAPSEKKKGKSLIPERVTKGLGSAGSKFDARMEQWGTSGCVYFKGAASINVGATENFYGFFDNDLSHKLEFFKTELVDWKKCGGNKPPKIDVHEPEPAALSPEFKTVVHESGLIETSLRRRSAHSFKCQPGMYPKNILSVLSFGL